jgi:hypothetical protein
MTGSVRLTADGVVGPSGSPIRVHSVEMLNDSSVGELVLRNGTADSATIYVKKNGATVSDTDTYQWTGGLVFPAGCFFDKDTNTVAAVINFEAI